MMKMKVFLLILCAFMASVVLIGCEQNETAEALPTEKTYSLLSDRSFQNGLGVISADHSLYDGAYSAELDFYGNT